MAEGVPPGLTGTRRGRQFGFTIGSAFLILTPILMWRNHGVAAIATGVGALMLCLAALLVPTRLLPIERRWMRIAHAISKVTTPIILGIVYFAVVTPIGFIVRKWKGNPLAREEGAGGFWIARSADRTGRGGMNRQF